LYLYESISFFYLYESNIFNYHMHLQQNIYLLHTAADMLVFVTCIRPKLKYNQTYIFCMFKILSIQYEYTCTEHA
jgi:hypothetical protein